MDCVTCENTFNARRAFEAIAHIIGKRENVEITVKSVQRVKEDERKKETA